MSPSASTSAPALTAAVGDTAGPRAAGTGSTLDDAAVDAVVQLLVDDDTHRWRPCHVDRRTPVDRATWHTWLVQGGPAASPVAVDPPVGAPLTAARTALRSIDDEFGIQGLAREEVVRVSRSIVRPSTGRCSVLWILAMMWNAEGADARAPWHAAQSLGDPATASTLVESVRRLRSGDLVGAFALTESIPGAGQHATAAWLWAACLGSTDPFDPIAVPLGRSVRRGLAEAGVVPGGGRLGYLGYLRLVTTVAGRLRRLHDGRGVVAEEVALRLAMIGGRRR